MIPLTRFVRTVFLLVLSPLMLLAAVLSLALTDLLWRLCGAGSQPAAASQAAPLPRAATPVSPNPHRRHPLGVLAAPLRGGVPAPGGPPPAPPAPQCRHRSNPQLERARTPGALPPVRGRRAGRQSGKRDRGGRQWLRGWQRRVRGEGVS